MGLCGRVVMLCCLMALFVAPATAFGREARWVDVDLASPELDAQGFETKRLYVAAEPGYRLLMAGSGPYAETRETGDVTPLMSTAPVYENRFGSEVGIESAALFDTALARDTFVMLGELDRIPAVFGYTSWSAGFNGIWYRIGGASERVDPATFGDGRAWIAVLQVTLPPGGEVTGELMLGWGNRNVGRDTFMEVIEAPSFSAASSRSGGDPAPPLPNDPGAAAEPIADESSGGAAADVTGDGVVDDRDIVAVLGNWGSMTTDVTGDGTTDERDLATAFAAAGYDPAGLSSKDWRREVRTFYRDELRRSIRELPKRERKPAKKRIFKLVPKLY